MKHIIYGISMVVTAWILSAEASPLEHKYEKFGINILEEGTEFQQGVDLDEDEHIVTVHVPAHNDVDETYFITDTRKHLTMRVAPQQKMCFLTKNDPEELPPANVWRKTKNIVQDSMINSKEVRKRNTVYQTLGPLTDDQRSELGIQMSQMCKHLPIMLVHPLDIPKSTWSDDNAVTFSKDEFSVMDLPKRDKRHANSDQAQSDVPFVDMCPMNRIKQKCLLRLQDCKYVRICDTHTDVYGRESSQCNLGHLIGQVICCKPCCLDQVPGGSLYCYDSRLNKDNICTW